MRKSWLLLVQMACISLITAGFAVTLVLYFESRNQFSACERGNVIRSTISQNAESNRQGWLIARRARLRAAHLASDPKEAAIDAAAAEGYRIRAAELRGVPQVDCKSVIR